MNWTPRRPAGLVLITPEFGPPVERPTLQCAHCGGHWLVEPGSGRQRGWCMSCAGPTCGSAWCETHCVPQERLLELIERRLSRERLLAAVEG